MKLERMTVGMTLYDCHRTKMGNTTMSRMGCWPVLIKEIDIEHSRALVVWNMLNAPQWWNRKRLEKLRRTPLKEKAV